MDTFEKIIQLSEERLITPSGLSLVGQLLGKSRFIKKCNTFWTNLDWNDDAVIKGYHAHGECEQYHSEIKTDMDVERLPSGKFETNELVLELTILAYNILRMIGQASLKNRRAPKSKHPVKRCRIRIVISNLIHIAGHVTTHGRRVILALGRSNIWREAFIDVYKRFALT